MKKQDLISLDAVLRHITKHVYDKGHGLLGPPNWVVDAEPLLERLRKLSGLKKSEFRKRFDAARVTVHGKDIDLS